MRVSLLDVPLHLGPAVDGAEATVEGVLWDIVRHGRPCGHVLSPDPDELARVALSLGAKTKIVQEYPSGAVVRITMVSLTSGKERNATEKPLR